MHASKWIYGKIIISFILLSDIGLSESSAQTRDCHFTLTRESGYFQTPDFPSKYPSNIECIWNIQVQPGHFILLSFDVFEIESYKGKCIDIVEVKDGNKSSDELLGVFCDTRLPPNVITSSTNSLRIWFFSDKSDAHQGFNASYKSQLEQGCGGLLSNTSGSISSPRFPDYPYPNSLECDWIITVPRGKFIRLQFSTDYEIEFNCDKKCKCVDYLELWDGPESNKTQIGSFCISIPPLIVSKSSRMKIRFVTNTEGRFKGFGLSYTTSMTPGCGGDIAGESGVIQSPNYPESFPTFSDCVWRIRAPADRYISFRFDEFSGINGTNSECSVNAIELREGYSREAQVLGRYCAQNVPPVIVTKGSDLFIHFQERNAGASSNSFTHRRFKGTYLTHSTDCNESIGLQDGRVRDSQLSASSYFSLKLGRGQLYMTPQYGRVGSAYSWCSQRQMLNKTVGEYFEIDLLNFTEITAIATQGYQLPSTIYWGYVSRYRVEYSYDGNHWISYRDNKEHSSNIGFTAFTGNKNVKDIRKNVLAPAIIAKKIRLLPTRFLSNPVQHMCLRAELYGCLFDRGCGGIISMERLGKISVRGIYGQSKLCRWLFIHSNSTSSNIIVNFHFTYFDVPCRHGYVTLHDRHGGKRKTYCGASPPIVPSLPASSQIALEIQLENSSDVWGFELKYRTESIGCGAILEISTDNKLVSPRYPLPYQHNQDCTWILLTSSGYKIAVRFIEFDLQPPYNKKCQDYVQIQNGRQDYSPVLGKFCGKHVPGQVISTFNKMRITFHSDNTTTAKGFVLQYSVIPPKRLPNTTFRQANVSPEQTEKPLTSSAATSASGQEKRERNKGHSRRASPCLLCLLPLLIIAIPEK